MRVTGVNQRGHRRLSLLVGCVDPGRHHRTLHGPAPHQVRVENLAADTALQGVFDVGGVCHGAAP